MTMGLTPGHTHRYDILNRITPEIKVCFDFKKNTKDSGTNYIFFIFKDVQMDKKYKNIVSNESGSAMVMAMVILAVLTILGISSINTSTIELQIVHNEKIYQQNFYQAESAAIEGVQKLEDVGSSDTALAQTWCKKSSDDYDDDYDDYDASDTDDPEVWTDADPDDNLGIDATVSVVLKGRDPTSSLNMAPDSKSKYMYKIRGYGKADNGKVLIEIGYKIRH